MKYFSIHNFVGIEVEEQYKWDKTLIVNIPMFETNKEEYEKIKTKILIHYNKKVNINGAYEVVPNIFINRNTNQLFDKKYGVLISKKENVYIIECNQECNEWMMILLEYSLLENGATFIHSAGVEKNGKAYVFPSWGGVGKTASVAKLIKENGYKLLGDDLVILTKNKDVYAFPKKFVLYNYHKKLFEENLKGKKLIGGKISHIVSKIIPTIKSILRNFPFILSWARRHNPQSKRISPYNIFGEQNISKYAKLTKFTWLERIEIEKTRIINIDAFKLATKSLIITIHELFDDRLQEFLIALCADCFDYKVLFSDSVNFINSAIENVKINQLFIPQAYPVEMVARDVVEYTNKE